MLHSHSSFHFITLTPDHLDIAGIAGVDLDLLPQMPDMYRHRAFAAQGRFLPHGFIQVLGGEYLAGVAHQKFQDIVLTILQTKKKLNKQSMNTLIKTIKSLD